MNSRANKRCNGLFLSHIFRKSSEIKASENLAHHRDRKNYNNLKNYNRLSKWDSALSLANNFSLSLSSGRERKGRRKNPSQEGEEEHRFNSESFSRECSPDKNLPPSKLARIFNARKRERNAFHVQQSGSSWLRFIFSSACIASILLLAIEEILRRIFFAGRRKRVQIPPSYSRP